jgi:hypothetical protein
LFALFDYYLNTRFEIKHPGAKIFCERDSGRGMSPRVAKDFDPPTSRPDGLTVPFIVHPRKDRLMRAERAPPLEFCDRRVASRSSPNRFARGGAG